MKFTNKNVFEASKHTIEPEVCLKERQKKHASDYSGYQISR